VFIPLQIAPRQQHYLERVLPAAVFINFAVYIAYTRRCASRSWRRCPWRWSLVSPCSTGWG
jgi:hypothetical protein